ncbi:MAG: hypothetical protein QM784_01465 [Polyangiaceae bacterium]
MTEDDWGNPNTRSLVMFLAGRGIDDVDEVGRPIVDDDLLVAFNSSDTTLALRLPAVPHVEQWELLLDTAEGDGGVAAEPTQEVSLLPHSLRLYRAPSRALRRGGAQHTFGATYRLQLRHDFDLRAVRAQVDYFEATRDHGSVPFANIPSCHRKYARIRRRGSSGYLIPSWAP